jgi:hypothetical protein
MVVILTVALEFSLVEVGIYLNDDVLPGGESGRTIDDTDEAILDGWLETFHESVNLRLLRHVEVRGELEEPSKILESGAGLVKTIKGLVGSEGETRVGEFELEMSNEKFPVLENGGTRSLEVIEPFDRYPILEVKTSEHNTLIVSRETGGVELHNTVKLRKERSNLLVAAIKHARVADFDGAASTRGVASERCTGERSLDRLGSRVLSGNVVLDSVATT